MDEKFRAYLEGAEWRDIDEMEDYTVDEWFEIGKHVAKLSKNLVEQRDDLLLKLASLTREFE